MGCRNDLGFIWIVLIFYIPYDLAHFFTRKYCWKKIKTTEACICSSATFIPEHYNSKFHQSLTLQYGYTYRLHRGI
jgi:hypothetical protein